MLLTTLDDVYDYIQEQLEDVCSQIRPEFEEHSCDTDRGIQEWANISLKNAPETVFIGFEFYYATKKKELLGEIVDALSDFKYCINNTDYEVRAELLSLHLSGKGDVELIVKLNYEYQRLGG